MSFLDALAQQGVINRYQIDDITEKMQETKGDLEQALFDLRIDQDGVRKAKAAYYRLPEVVLDVNTVSLDTLQNIPENSARHYRSVAFDINSETKTVKVGMVDPGDLEAQNALQFIFAEKGMAYQIYVISFEDFQHVIQKFTDYGVSASTPSDDESGPKVASSVRSLDDTLDGGGKVGPDGQIVEDAPATKTVAHILKKAIETGVSDIHIEHTEKNMKVRFRLDGDLQVDRIIRKDMANAIVARVKILAQMKLDEKRKPQDNRFYARIGGRKVDFRVSTMPTFFGEKVVIRILDPDKGVNSLDKTGMTDAHLDAVRAAIGKSYGMILVTGPTGSGKSTTLYSMLGEVDKDTKNVISLEDPVEYNMDGMSQSQVHAEIGYTFAAGLRSILRQDPDVIMVGEIRDKETAMLAIGAALTGHLVFSTLHTNTAIGAIPRLIDMGVDPYLIAPTLLLVIGQRLMKRICPDAKVPQPVAGGVKAIIDHQLQSLHAETRAALPLGSQVFMPGQTEACPTGTKGRVGVFETFVVDEEVERMILNDPREQVIHDYMRQERGMLGMKDDAIIKCMEGLLPWSQVNEL